MTRQFRGKRVDNGEWVYGGLIFGMPHYSHTKYPVIVEKGGSLNTYHKVIPSSVEQATGLKDKDGFNIYEGDVVQWHTNDNEKYGIRLVCSSDEPMEVKWDGVSSPFLTHWKNPQKTINDIGLKIIGNLTDNPDLVKEREDEVS